MKRRLTGLTLLVAVALVAIGVSVSYGAKKETTTLTMWSCDNQDPGLQPVLQQLSKDFEKSHPGVKINIVFKSFNSLVDTVPRALASGNGPDITEGNQGYQTDAQLVKAKLIMPLDRTSRSTAGTSCARRRPGACSAGRPTGSRSARARLGHRPDRPERRRLLNKKKIRQAASIPTMPRRCRVRQDARRRCGRSCRRVTRCSRWQQGGLRHHPLLRRHLGRERQAQPSATGSTTCRARPSIRRGTIQALTKLQSGARPATSTATTTRSATTQAAAEFAKGKGLFFDRRQLGHGDHQDGPRSGNVGMINMPPGPSGKYAGVGGHVRPVAHLGEDEVSRRRRGVAELHPSPRPRPWTDVRPLQIPAIAGAKPPAGDAYPRRGHRVREGCANDDGLPLYADWASPSMYDTLAEVLPGGHVPEDDPRRTMAKADPGRLGEVRRRAEGWSRALNPSSSTPTARPGSHVIPGRRAAAPAHGPGRRRRAAQRRAGSTSCRASPSTSSSRSPRSCTRPGCRCTRGTA